MVAGLSDAQEEQETTKGQPAEGCPRSNLQRLFHGAVNKRSSKRPKAAYPARDTSTYCGMESGALVQVTYFAFCTSNPLANASSLKIALSCSSPSSLAAFPLQLPQQKATVTLPTLIDCS
jgi:hypothetical protein